jgi:hypothetical protein
MSTFADKASSPRVAPNLFLQGYSEDDVLARDELAEEWGVTTRTVRNLQSEENGLPFFMNGGKVFFRAGSAREFMRRREQRRNRNNRYRGER